MPIKRRYQVAGIGGARGYTPFGVETAKGATHHDLKEFWQIGRELPPGHRYRSSMPDNVWIADDPGFKRAALELWEAFDRMGRKLLESIAEYLGLRAPLVRRQGGRGQQRPARHPLPAAQGRCDRRARGRARGHQRHHAPARRGGRRTRTPRPERALAADQSAAGNARVQRGRHAAAADEPRAAVDDPPRRQSDGREGQSSALLDAFLPALQFGLPDRDAPGLHHARAAQPLSGADPRGRLPARAAARDQAASTEWRSSTSTTRR